jgi:rhodanese-related sulfurtransferase/ABC-type phosphate/phosphonate transport system substrate-binding protein
MKRAFVWALSGLFFYATVAAGELKVMVGVDPSDREAIVISLLDLQASLSRATGETVKASRSQDLGDVMRTTRTGEYDVYIAPAHVAASALSHGYALIGSTDRDEIYQLVSRPGLKAPADLKDRKMYLTQQDSVGAYVARGMLNESGQSLKILNQVMYRRTSGAGLFAIDTGLVDATVAKRGDIDTWIKENNSKCVVLMSSHAVPGGMSVVVKKNLPDATKTRLETWFLGPTGTMSGIGKVSYHSDLANYKYVAALGNWTPSQLPGATIVTAPEVVAMQQRGVLLVDVRIAKEYQDRHIKGAISIPYNEKSLKDVAFDPAADEWAGPEKLDKNQPVIFQCNGPECWKSYKAARVALTKGFRTVYWFRGGYPEWEIAGLPVESTMVANEPARPVAQTAATKR